MKLLDFEIPSFSRMSWVSKAVKDEWEPKLLKARSAYSELELESVTHGLRKCVIRNVSPDYLIAFMDKLAERQLVFLPIRKVGGSSEYAHRYTSAKEGSSWKWYGVVAKSYEDASKLKSLVLEDEENIDHEAIGELLGYPKCCTHFFTEKWGAGYIDPVWQEAENVASAHVLKKEDHLIKVSHELPYETNLMLRYIGIRLVPHIPCSLDCKDTAHMASSWMNLGRELGIDGLNELEEFLRLPVQWDCLKGIAYVATPLFKIETNSMTCYPNYVVQRMGTFYPKYLPRGLSFPYRMEQSVPKHIIEQML